MVSRRISVVVPVYNEAESLPELCEAILEHAGRVSEDLEVLFVDDGSSDGSGRVVEELCRRDPRVGLIAFGVNAGKSAALDAGFRRVSGDVVVTLDGDLQDDPKEIPRLVAKLDEGYDLVSGWKVKRRDPWHKTAPSRLFNAVVRTVFRVPLHDFNCGFKAYRRSVVDRLHIYGELHRFIPVLAAGMGARIAELPVEHHPRRYGRSKYGLGRLVKGLLDLVTVLVTVRYIQRPLHLFGSVGLASAGVGGLLLAYLAVLWLAGVRPIGNRPLLFYAMLLAILGVQLFSFGILAELLTRFGGRRGGPMIVTSEGCARERDGADPAAGPERDAHGGG